MNDILSHVLNVLQGQDVVFPANDPPFNRPFLHPWQVERHVIDADGLRVWIRDTSTSASQIRLVTIPKATAERFVSRGGGSDKTHAIRLLTSRILEDVLTTNPAEDLVID